MLKSLKSVAVRHNVKIISILGISYCVQYLLFLVSYDKIGVLVVSMFDADFLQFVSDSVSTKTNKNTVNAQSYVDM